MGIHERICQLLVLIHTSKLLGVKQDGRVEIQPKKVRVYAMHCGHIYTLSVDNYFEFESSSPIKLSRKVNLENHASRPWLFKFTI